MQRQTLHPMIAANKKVTMTHFWGEYKLLFLIDVAPVQRT